MADFSVLDVFGLGFILVFTFEIDLHESEVDVIG